VINIVIILTKKKEDLQLEKELPRRNTICITKDLIRTKAHLKKS
jgi:hypothetical protein